jgi:two-component system, OmpR family, osmolarity sensor histidine kinase EnvZ
MKRRPQTLFVRLLVMQAALVLGLTTLFGVFFYAERNVTVSRLVAERWTPVLRQAVEAHAAPAPAPAPAALAVPLLRQSETPRPSLPAPAIGPRIASLKSALFEQGVAVDRVAIGYGSSGARIWLHVPAAGAEAWFGMPGDEILPRLPLRFIALLVFGVALVVGISTLFTRRLIRPLQQIGAAMRQQRPDLSPPQVPVPAVDAHAPPELQAIDTAWRELMARYRQHESERALLLAGVSHDLRSPLGRIRMAADLLPPEAEARRQSIVRNVQVADRLIGSFLDHVRAGELPLDQRCELGAVAQRVLARFEAAADTLTLRCDKPAWLDNSNAELLERLITNLVDNAFAHGRAPVQVQVRHDGDTVSLTVSDSGPGIAAAQWAAATRAFARGDVSRGSPGSGLGLAIADRIVRRTGGQLAPLHDAPRFTVLARWPASRAGH